MAEPLQLSQVWDFFYEAVRLQIPLLVVYHQPSHLGKLTIDFLEERHLGGSVSRSSIRENGPSSVIDVVNGLPLQSR